MTNGTHRLRRRLIVGGAGALAGAVFAPLSRVAFAQAATIELPFVNGKRNLAAYPERRPMIVLTSRPPQIETPFEVFNESLMTPNDAFAVPYHNAGIPTSIDGDQHVIGIGGNAVGKPFELPELSAEGLCQRPRPTSSKNLISPPQHVF
jgi:hypothetical protein